MSRSVRLIAVTIGAAILLVGNAAATTITTTCFNSGTCSSGLWNSSAFIAGSFTDVDLSGASGTYPSGYSHGGFTFSGPNLGGTFISNREGLTGSSINVAFPAGGETALFLWEISGSYNVTLSDGEVFNGISGTWGFSSTTPMTSLTITTNSGNILLYDLSYATTSLTPSSSTPEAATLLMTSGGLCVLLGSGRKRRHKAAA